MEVNTYLKNTVAVALHLLAIGFLSVWCAILAKFSFGVAELLIWTIAGALSVQECFGWSETKS